jgi:hypothetical protein
VVRREHEEHAPAVLEQVGARASRVESRPLEPRQQWLAARRVAGATGVVRARLASAARDALEGERRQQQRSAREDPEPDARICVRLAVDGQVLRSVDCGGRRLEGR